MSSLCSKVDRKFFSLIFGFNNPRGLPIEKFDFCAKVGILMERMSCSFYSGELFPSVAGLVKDWYLSCSQLWFWSSFPFPKILFGSLVKTCFIYFIPHSWLKLTILSFKMSRCHWSFIEAWFTWEKYINNLIFLQLFTMQWGHCQTF